MPEEVVVDRQTVAAGSRRSFDYNWMGATYFLARGLQHVGTEMSLYVLAYNVKRSMTIFSVKPMLQAMRG